MLSNIFQDILIELNKKTGLEESLLAPILKYIQQKCNNTYIYPEKVSEDFNIELKIIFKIFIFLEKKNILKQVYKVYCPDCRDFSSEIFEDFNSLEEYTNCEKCDKELFDEDNIYKYITMYFKVISNG